MKIINTTPHRVVIGERVFEPALLLRLSTETVSDGELGGIPLTKTKYGSCENLPTFSEDVCYIVSSILAQAYPERSDFLMVGETIRDGEGRIVGAKSLCRNPFGGGSK